MFGSRRQLISERIIRCAFIYASVLGITCFHVKCIRNDDRLVARNCNWYKWLCLLTRILLGYFYFKKYEIGNLDFNISHFKLLICIRVFGCLIFAGVILVMQFCYGQQVLRVINKFFKLFRKVNALPGGLNMGLAGKRELSLLICSVLSLLYEVFCVFAALFVDFTTVLKVLCEVYTSLSTAMIYHILFMGYLSVGALYEQVNSYVRHELQQQLRNLEQSNSRRQLQEAGYRLDECLAIYDEIQHVANDYQQLFELPLSMILLFGFLNMGLVCFNLLLGQTHAIQLQFLVIKIFVDLLLLILAIHGARSSSRVIRRLSLENYYVSERTDWQMRLEIFLSRLHYYEFRVRPLGLFEVSNELILVFLSGLITYLTYIVQYSMQSQQL